MAKRSESIERSRNKDAERILSDRSPWPIREAYRALRTNIIFSLPGEGCKIIGVTSAERGEGKSTSCINTASIFGELGKKVLLIEGDLRLPTVAVKLEINTTPGLTDVIAGQAQLNDALRKNAKPGLDVLTAGTIPPDPTWLLQSNQMKQIIDICKKHYDYIFIDLPPVNAVADASIISHFIDGFLLTVRDHKTEYPAIADMLTQLKLAEAKIIGFLYYDIQQSGGSNNHYYRGYYK